MNMLNEHSPPTSIKHSCSNQQEIWPLIVKRHFAEIRTFFFNLRLLISWPIFQIRLKWILRSSYQSLHWMPTALAAWMCWGRSITKKILIWLEIQGRTLEERKPIIIMIIKVTPALGLAVCQGLLEALSTHLFPRTPLIRNCYNRHFTDKAPRSQMIYQRSL